MANITLDPYIFFTGNCREAMEFYNNIFGGELTIQTMKDMHMGDSNRVMHSRLQGGLVSFMASDGEREEPYPVCRITLSLSGDDKDELTKVFNALSEGGKVTSELKVEAWGDTFGTVTDKFGVDWMVNINAPKAN